MATVNMTQYPNYLLVTLQGELTMLSSGEIKTEVKEKIESLPKMPIIVDMTGVELVDSSGLGVLIAWFKQVNQLQSRIIYAGCSSYVMKIIGFAKLDQILTIAENMDTAVTML